MQETRYLKISFNKSGGSSVGGITYRVTLPKKWIDKMKINESNRDVAASFDGKRIIIEKGGKIMTTNQIISFLNAKKVKEKDWFTKYFELGNYTHQDQNEEATIDVEDGSIFVTVLDSHDYACVSVFDKDENEIECVYITYKALQKLKNKITEK